MNVVVLFMFFLPVLAINNACSITDARVVDRLNVVSRRVRFTGFTASVNVTTFYPFLCELMIVHQRGVVYLTKFSLVCVFDCVYTGASDIFLLTLYDVFVKFLQVILVVIGLFALVGCTKRVRTCSGVAPNGRPAASRN